ncbi:hypothetical protein JCM8547_005769 [Rhodosporidiobolus lusitaniae]
MASNEHEGPCCVCGQITTQRCSACSKSGVSLFFSSSEHQKSVYFAHKRVCGKHPFSPLSSPSKEAEEAKAKANIAPIATQLHETRSTGIQQMIQCGSGEVPSVIDSLTEGRVPPYSLAMTDNLLILPFQNHIAIDRTNLGAFLAPALQDTLSHFHHQLLSSAALAWSGIKAAKTSLVAPAQQEKDKASREMDSRAELQRTSGSAWRPIFLALESHKEGLAKAVLDNLLQYQLFDECRKKMKAILPQAN